MKTLTQVLTDARGELPTLRRHGLSASAEAIEKLLDEVAESAAPFLEFLSEPQAMLRSGRSAEWLRRRFPTWQRQGLARLAGGHREYLKVVAASRSITRPDIALGGPNPVRSGDASAESGRQSVPEPSLARVDSVTLTLDRADAVHLLTYADSARRRAIDGGGTSQFWRRITRLLAVAVAP